MGLVSKLFGFGARKRLISLQGNGEFAVEADCEANYQPSLEKIAGHTPDEVCEVPCHAELVPEPNGRVSVRIRAQTVGCLKEQMAVDYLDRATSLGLQGLACCDAMIVGGWAGHDGEEGTFGVKLDLVWPIRVAGQ